MARLGTSITLAGCVAGGLVLSACGGVLPGFYSDDGARQDMIDDCVEYVQMGAFVGDEAIAEVWTSVDQDDAELRRYCEGLAETAPATLDDYAERKHRMERSMEQATATLPANLLTATAITDVCSADYTGVCLPLAVLDQDVDCLVGGRGDDGDGPWFIDKTVIVMGDDVYELDSDGDGLGCEPL